MLGNLADDSPEINDVEKRFHLLLGAATICLAIVTVWLTRTTASSSAFDIDRPITSPRSMDPMVSSWCCCNLVIKDLFREVH